MSQTARDRTRQADGIEVHFVEPRDRADGFLYFDCPACSQYIREAFLPGGDPQMLIHHDGGGCRLVIDTDPMGSDHRIIEVPRGEGRLEDVLLECARDEDRLTDRLQARAAYVSNHIGGGSR